MKTIQYFIGNLAATPAIGGPLPSQGASSFIPPPFHQLYKFLLDSLLSPPAQTLINLRNLPARDRINLFSIDIMYFLLTEYNILILHPGSWGSNGFQS